MRFYLGLPEPGWLARTSVPAMVSARRLRSRHTGRLPRRLPVAQGPWVLDSGAFTELDDHGRWTVPPARYAREVARCHAETGRLVWAAVQDWPCEPGMRARTGLRISEHQARTIGSYLELSALAPDLPWLPVLQGWQIPGDYLACLDRYHAAGIDLTRLPLVGLGSVCRRQATRSVRGLVAVLADAGIRLHGFGVKADGLARYAADLASADSMAWSAGARRRSIRLPGCAHGPTGYGTCASCLAYALAWRADLLDRLAATPWQPRLPATATEAVGEVAC